MRFANGLIIILQEQETLINTQRDKIDELQASINQNFSCSSSETESKEESQEANPEQGTVSDDQI